MSLSPSGCDDGWPQRATPTKYLLCVIFLLFAACRAQNEPAAPHGVSTESVVSSTPPFQTKEPERYSATRIITVVTAEGKTTVTKTSIARDGEMRRSESGKVAYLDLLDGRFILLPDDKVYADLANETNLGDDDEEEVSPERLLHDEATNTSYQKIGTELIHGHNSTKYRIVVNSSTPGSVSLSEVIWIDEVLNMPIRSEMTSADGINITMELSDVALAVDKRLFQIPDDYKKVAFSELRKRLKD